MRLDHHIISSLVESGSRVLDLGCGDGELMDILEHQKKANVQGVELDEQSIYQCVAKGLSVFHSDIDTGLVGYPDQSFDYVILNQSMQQIKKVDYALQEGLRVGKKVIVGFPNFGFWKIRWMVTFEGRMPVTPDLPHRWNDTPNLRFLTLRDFVRYGQSKGFRILSRHYLGPRRRVYLWPNLLAANALFVITRH